MPTDARKAFINILTSLIEKSPDSKLLKTLTKIVEDWIKPKVCVCVCVWGGGECVHVCACTI